VKKVPQNLGYFCNLNKIVKIPIVKIPIVKIIIVKIIVKIVKSSN
jgi:hypothetical protein